MASLQDKPIVRIAPNSLVFDLPVIVGIEKGLFAQAAGESAHGNLVVGWAGVNRIVKLRQRWQPAPKQGACIS